MDCTVIFLENILHIFPVQIYLQQKFEFEILIFYRSINISKGCLNSQFFFDGFGFLHVIVFRSILFDITKITSLEWKKLQDYSRNLHAFQILYHLWFCDTFSDFSCRLIGSSQVFTIIFHKFYVISYWSKSIFFSLSFEHLKQLKQI